MANVQITQLPAANPLTGTESVPVVQQGITVRTTTGAIAAASAPMVNGEFVLVNSNPLFPNSRYLSSSLPITVTDNGAGSNIVVGMYDSTVTPGSYTNANITINSKGIITSASNGSDIVGITQINTGFGLLGGPITTTGTISVDNNVVATLTNIQTLTNKTLISPVISTIVNTGTLTLPTTTDTLVGRATYDYLTNKSINGNSNTITNISNGSLVHSSIVIGSDVVSLGDAITTFSGVSISGYSNSLTDIGNSSLLNSSITINGSTVSLGGSINITASTSYPLTIGFGLTGGSYDGSSPVYIGIDSNVVTLNGTQTLTNKTIDASLNSIFDIPNSSLINSSVVLGTTNVPLGSTALVLNGLDTITVTQNPSNDYELATKLYVDTVAATGLDIHPAVQVDADGNVNATYTGGGTTPTWNTITSNSILDCGSAHGLSVNDVIVFGSTTNGIVGGTPYFVESTPSSTSITISVNWDGSPITTLVNGTSLGITSLANSGVGATLVSNTNGQFSEEGYDALLGDRILLLGQTNAVENGVYEITVQGNASTPWEAIRASDANKFGLNNSTTLGNNSYFLVLNGNDAGEAYVCNVASTIVFGTTDITFAEFSRVPQYSAGTGLNLNNFVFSIANTGVTANTYGSASSVPVLAVNAQGQITTANNTSISIDGNQITSGVVGISYGGTGASSASSAFNALSPITSTGDLIIGNGTNSATRLAIGTNGYVLTSNGTTASWQPTASTGGTVTSVSGTGTVSGITLSGTVTSSGNLTLGGALDLSSPPAIGNTTPNTGAFTTLSASSTVSGTGFSTYLASPPAIGSTVANAGAFTTLSASSTVSGTGFSTYLASPPAIGGTTANTGRFSDLTDTSLTSGRVTYATTGGNLTDSANLTFNGTTLTTTAVVTPSVTASTDNLTLSAISTGAVKFNTLGGLQAQVSDTSGVDSYVNLSGGVGAATVAAGSASGNIDLRLDSRASGSVRFRTAGSLEQMRVSHTASAVNYVQVTGAATGGFVAISAQGSDSNPGIYYTTKGFGSHRFTTNTGGGSEQFRIITNSASTVNFLQVNGSATTLAPQFSAQGTDTNISMAFQPKGTGAIDLAAGSSGVNISNGGTVTAVTVSTRGSGYTALPSVAISAPTTAGGVQATATALLNLNTLTLVSGGTGYTVNDVLTVSGITGGTVQLTVNTVAAGVIATFTVTNYGSGTISAIPANPVSVTGGTGTGATFTANWNCGNITVGTAGSGYVEQPTVTITGSASNGTAYATVGSVPIIRSLAGSSGSTSSLSFYTPAGESVRINDQGVASSGYVQLQGASATSGGSYVTSSYQSLYLSATGGQQIGFFTNGQGQTRQFNIAHTASAVNYVQVTGGATGSAPTISTQGSDANAGLVVQSKGTSPLYLVTLGATDVRIQPNNIRALSVNSVGSAVNYGVWTNSATTFAPALSVAGTDTNIDLALTPKGTGGVIVGNNQVNYQKLYGAATGLAVQHQAVGSDTNVSMALQTQGTGAIDLAAGSNGVNISNGGTVTAITRIAAGTGYTSLPTMTISAPTTAGGVQATATYTMGLAGVPTITSGGTGYTVGDTLTFVGGTGGVATLTVSTVSAGVITGVTVGSFGTYTALPTNPISVTGGTGSSATFTATWAINSVFTITNAGSGYIEQPTITFSGGGGSGASAFAFIGSAPTVKALGGAQLNIATAGGTNFAVSDSGLSSPTTYAYATGGGSSAGFGIISGNANAGFTFTSKGTSAIDFYTNNYGSLGLKVSHVASANRYVDISGGVQGTTAPGIGTGGGNEAFDIFSNANAIRFSTGGAKSSSLQFTVASTSSPVNYFSVTGAPTTKAVIQSVIGADTNISSAIVSKGTGGVDLATGSTGVNISNGLGNVTALARTVAGSGYTTPPTWTATAPQTNGGTTASGSVTNIGVVTATVSAGGTGYVVGDILTVSGGTSTTAATLTVATLSGSAVATVTISNAGAYTAVPANPAATTGGTGTGATFTLSFGINNAFTITTAGTGYLEQPTITLSGGGGTSAAAIATVGSAPVVRSLGTAMSFFTPSGEAFRISDNTTGTATGYWTTYGASNSPQLRAIGSTSGVIGTNSAVPLQFQTNMGTAPVEQFRVAHTATAVNYLQVTGNVTANPPTISAQGTDVSVALRLATKSSAGMQFYVNNVRQVNISNTSSAVNYIDLTGGATGAPGFVTMSAQGTDANIDLVLNPKGTGLIKLGTAYVAGAPVATGYISVKDSTGTTYKILVST